MQTSAHLPSVVGLSVVKNEQDIIEPFVRHNLRFLNSLFVLDNGSVDNTLRILRQLQQELPGLIILEDDRFVHCQAARMTKLLRAAQQSYQPDYVAPLDADEFIGAADAAEFREVLRQIPAGGFGLVPWRTLVATPDAAAACGQDPPGSFQWRRREESPAFYKVILNVSGQSVEDLVIEHGSHHVRSISGRDLASVNLDQLSLLHVPVRSRDQFIGKIVVGWMTALARNREARRLGLAWHKREIFVKLTNGHVLDDRGLCELSLLYAQDAKAVDWQHDVVREHPGFRYVRRYSDGAPLDAVRLIARSWEQSFHDQAGSNGDGLHRKSAPGDHKDSAEYALAVLLDVYAGRPDLRDAFPEVEDFEYGQLIQWAVEILAGQWEDPARASLQPYAQWYSRLSPLEIDDARTRRALAERDQAIRERDGAQQLLADAEQQLARERSLRGAMQDSVSWRVTEPARGFMTALRGGPRRSNQRIHTIVSETRPSIAILTHSTDDFWNVGYLLPALVRRWEEMGVAVHVVSDRTPFVPADLAWLHVDLSVTPEETRRLAARYPRVVNGRVLDIRKRQYDHLLLHRDDRYEGPVIVKTDCNCGGWRELRHAVAESPLGPVLRKLQAQEKVIEAYRRLQTKLPWRWKRIISTRAYPVFDSLRDVPVGVWQNPNLIVERFLPERDGSDYCCHQWMFFGATEVHRLGRSSHPCVKYGDADVRTCVTLNHVVPEELRRIRQQLGLDYGTFDYGIVDGRPVLYDVNRTPGMSKDPAMRAHIIDVLSQAIWGMLEHAESKRRP